MPPLNLYDARYDAARTAILNRKRLLRHITRKRARKFQRVAGRVLRRRAKRVWEQRRHVKRFLGRAGSLHLPMHAESVENRAIEQALTDFRFEDGLRDLDEAVLACQLPGTMSKTRLMLAKQVHDMSLQLAGTVAMPCENPHMIAQALVPMACSLVEELARAPRRRKALSQLIRGEVNAVVEAARAILSGKGLPKSIREEATTVLAKWVFMVLHPLGLSLGWSQYKTPDSAGRIALLVCLGAALYLQGLWARHVLRRHTPKARMKNAAWLVRGMPAVRRFKTRVSADVVTGLGLGMLCYVIGGQLYRLQSWLSNLAVAIALGLILIHMIARLRR